MAMRITTKMMQNTSLRNLNTNKSRQEKLTNQLATGKKISRPSDDPVVAIRSLKLNASLDKIDQYYEKNAEDAQSWLDLTASAISTVNDILDTTIRPNINQAISSYMKVDDRQAIITNLTNAVQEIYSTGNADSGGRSIFTGYRTDMSLTLKEDKTELNVITEQLTNSAIEKTTFVATGDLKSINEGNYNDIGTYEFNVSTNDIYRIRLAYEDLDITADNKANVSLKVMNSDGTVAKEYTITDICATGTNDDSYNTVLENDDAITYIADTGEILLGANIQKELSELSSDTEIRVTYEKSEWKENDLDPVHYFYTERTDSATGKTVKYNENFLEDPSASGRQIIEYDIGNNQTIRVNTTADELFTHDMGRDVSEVVDMLNDYATLEENLDTVKDMIDSGKYDGENLTKLEEHKSALEKAMTYMGDKINNRCSELLTNCDKYLENTELAETNCGSRGTRLNLIKNRLSVQQTNYEELVSENEDADYTDLAVQLKSVEMTYEAALSSISYVMQTSLLDFI